jgi:hypothetical protein
LSEPVAPTPPTSFAPANARGIADGASGLHFAVIPQQSYIDTQGRDLCARDRANAAMFGGRFAQAVDLYRGTVGEDGYFDGLLGTMADGLLGSSRPLQGDPALVSALSDADGTPGDDPIMHPFAELRQCVKEMVGFGYSLGQYTLSCWRCRASGNENWEVLPARNSTGGECTHEVCRRCDASRIDRPLGVREVFTLHKWPLQSLWQETNSRQWYVTHRRGVMHIVPGDGEWALFRTVPALDGWQYGPYLWAILAAILARDSRFDRQATSHASTPQHIYSSNGDTHPETRADVERKVREAGFQVKMILPGKWSFDIKEPANRYHDVATGIIDDMRGMAEIGWFGNRISSSSGTAFTDAKPWFRVAAERRRALGVMLAQQLRDFGWQWWSLENFGTRNAPVAIYDTDSPEDKRARADAIAQLGTAFGTLQDGLAKVGYEVEGQWVVETCQRANVRVRKKEGGDTSKLPLGVDAVGSLVKGDEGRAGLGLGPFNDERGDMTINDPAEKATSEAPEVQQRRPRRRGRR